METIPKPQTTNNSNDTPSENNRNNKFLGKPVRIGLAAIAILAVLFIIKFLSSDESDSSRNLFSATDICRYYEGNIEKDETISDFRLSVSIGSPDGFTISVTDIYNSDNKNEYTGYIKKDKLVLTNGPNLLIAKTGKGKMTLCCDDKNNGKWTFVSI